ncbi:na(+)/H(+) antiporter [Monosporozyma unispora]|nr:Superoxide dismutase [Mn], mitochondrial [Kazachstania unispora]
MAVWEHLSVSKSHVAYACVGVFSAVFSLVSLFVKEKLYIGESTVAGIFGLIVGPVCLNWFNPLTWGNSDSITLEITRVVLCLQIFAVAVELPRKYMLKHWLSVTLLLVPVMTVGWLIIGLFVWIIIPGLNFSASLLISACITATDPILAQSVVSGKFAQRVPGHLRNLLSAESGCNDGMAFPFIFLSMNLILHPGNAREIVKDWICVTLLYECIFGCILGVFIGYVGKRAIRFAEEKNIIDRESFLAFYVVLSFCCAGFGSILGVDDLLVSFAAGTAFAWDGWFSDRTEESKVSTVIDLLLNYAYFIYFGAIIPWSQFNNGDIGCNVWRLILLSIIVIFLRRIPAVLVLKPLIPDIKSWREAIFVGHFGPIGVGAVFAAILSRAELESAVTEESTPLKHVPPKGTEHWQLMACIWPMTCFFIVTSIIVHGSSVAVITLGRHLNSITLTKTFTTHTTNGNGKPSWMQRLPSLDTKGRSFSLQRTDTHAPLQKEMSRTSTVETSGIPARPAGGMRRRRRNKRKERLRKHKKRISSVQRELFGAGNHDDELNDLGRERLQREREARAATFALTPSIRPEEIPSEEELSLGEDHEMGSYSTGATPEELYPPVVTSNVEALNDYPMYESEGEHDGDFHTEEEDNFEDYIPQPLSPDQYSYDMESRSKSPHKDSDDRSSTTFEEERKRQIEEDENTADTAYVDGDNVILENKHGEIIGEAAMAKGPRDEEEAVGLEHPSVTEEPHMSPIQSIVSGQPLSPLKKILSPNSLHKLRSLVDETASRRSSLSSESSLDNDSYHSKRRRKYHAYKMDQELIIENEDGEVVRRYKIHHHENSNKKKLDTVNKMLNSVGIRRNNSTKSKTSTDASSSIHEGRYAPEVLTKKHRTLTPAPHKATGYVPMSESEEETGDSYDDDEDDTTDDSGVSNDEYDDSDDYSDGFDEESETEFERQRRLHALGQAPAPEDATQNDDDEEELPITKSSTGQNTIDHQTTSSSKNNFTSKITKKLGFNK